jgi:hypothetical protein
VGATSGKGLPAPRERVRTNGCDHACSQTDPDHAERLAGIYGTAAHPIAAHPEADPMLYSSAEVQICASQVLTAIEAISAHNQRKETFVKRPGCPPHTA